MKIINSLDSLKSEFQHNSSSLEGAVCGLGPVITIGIFDGVHTGHVALLNRMVEISKLYQKESTVLTFSPHPRIVLLQDPQKLKILTSQNEKMKHFERLNIDNVVVLPFNQETASLTAEKFIEDILVNKLNISRLVVGFNHRFGSDRITSENLEKISEKFGFGLEKVPSFDIYNQIPSSSQIRELLFLGDIQQANKLLGYNYTIEGKVIEGNKIGRTMAFPTANIMVKETRKLIPANGVYASLVKVKNRCYKGMTNIGLRPTINEKNKHSSIEVHILDFDDNIYYEDIEIEFIEKIRDEIKFPNLKELKKQIELDMLNF